MKKVFSFIVLIALLSMFVLLSGCNSYTKATYHIKKGKIVKVDIEKVSAPVEQITESTKKKAVVYWRNGWGVELSASMFTPKNPFPHVRIEAFNSDGGFATFPKEKFKPADIAKIIMSTRTDLEINEKGVNSSPPEKPEKIQGADVGNAKVSAVPSEPG